MASPYNSTVTFDGNTFDAVEIVVTLDTTPDRNGMPTMGTLAAKVRVVADPSDQQNMPFSLVQKLFGYTNVATKDKIKQVKLEYWTDDSKQDALCSYQFNGWISGFQTVNPMGAQGAVGGGQGQTLTLNNMMVLDITPQLDSTNQPNFKLSN